MVPMPAKFTAVAMSSTQPLGPMYLAVVVNPPVTYQSCQFDRQTTKRLSGVI